MNFRHLYLMFVSLAAAPAFGANVITVDLDFSAVTLVPGTTVDFSGTIINDTSDYVYLNSITVQGLPADLSVDTSPFLNSPYPLNPNQNSGDFTFFSVTSPVSYAGPFGLIGATVTVLGGADPSPTFDYSENPLGGANIVLVVPAPEPATALLFVVGLLLVFASRWKFGARIRADRWLACSRTTAKPDTSDLNGLRQRAGTLTVAGPDCAGRRGMWRVQIMAPNEVGLRDSPQPR